MSGLAALWCALVGTPALADSFTFDFNTVAYSASANLAAGNSAISNYMTGYLTSHGCVGCSVVVTGGVADKTYNGEGYSTGPNGSPIRSLTLGNSDGATASNSNSALNSTTDIFLSNTNDNRSQVSDRIIMKFYGLTINGTVGFDYQIFPDNTCPQLTSAKCGGSPTTNGIYPNQPDLDFSAGAIGAAAPVIAFGVNGTQYGVKPNTTNGTATRSPHSATELAPQYIGHWSGSLANVTELDFIDWPATIGVDNLVITTAPEPAAIVLFGTVIAGALLLKRKRKNASSIAG